MSFDWNDYLQFAKFLNGENITQDLNLAKCRTAISRAYYAAHNITKVYLESHCSVDFKSKEINGIRKDLRINDHGLLPKILQTSDNDDIRYYGSRLDTLRGRRVKADYENSKIENINRKVNECIELSGEIINILEIFKKGKATIDLNILIRQ